MKSKKGTLQQVGDLVNFKKYAKKWYERFSFIRGTWVGLAFLAGGQGGVETIFGGGCMPLACHAWL